MAKTKRPVNDAAVEIGHDMIRRHANHVVDKGPSKTWADRLIDGTMDGPDYAIGGTIITHYDAQWSVRLRSVIVRYWNATEDGEIVYGAFADATLKHVASYVVTLLLESEKSMVEKVYSATAAIDSASPPKATL